MQKARLRSGHRFDEGTSALIKCLRRGREYDGFSHALDLAEAGHDLHVWGRLCVFAVEDVGLANPMATVLVNSLAQIWCRDRAVIRNRRTGKQVASLLPDRNILALAILFLARSPKNRQADDLACIVEQDRSAGKRVDIRPEAIDAHTARGRSALKKRARQEGRSWTDLWAKEFYGGTARSNRPTEVALGRKGLNWSKEMAKRSGCSYKKYMTPV